MAYNDACNECRKVFNLDMLEQHIPCYVHAAEGEFFAMTHLPPNTLRESVQESITQEADRLVDGSRQNDYGHPFDNWTRTARIISGILGVEVTAEQAVQIMIGVKQAREMHKHSRDNLVDIAGYAKVLDMIVEERQKRAQYDMTDDD